MLLIKGFAMPRLETRSAYYPPMIESAPIEIGYRGKSPLPQMPIQQAGLPAVVVATVLFAVNLGLFQLLFPRHGDPFLGVCGLFLANLLLAALTPITTLLTQHFAVKQAVKPVLLVNLSPLLICIGVVVLVAYVFTHLPVC